MNKNPPDEEKINQQVTLSGNARAGDITLIGKIVKVIQRPSTWQVYIVPFLRKRWKFIVVACVLQVLLAAAYLPLRNLYLIPLWQWTLAAILLLVAAWGWYHWIWIGRNKVALITTLSVTASFVGLVGLQSWQIAFPKRFDPEIFGIALAELGEGPGFAHTGNAKLFSDQIYESLCDEIRKAIPIRSKGVPCGAVDKNTGSTPVFVTRLGVVPDSQTARTQGERIGADIVIWGQILTAGSNGVTIRFQVNETLDRAVNPEFPLILPVTSTSTEIVNNELDLERDPIKVKEAIRRQSLIISSFALGLNAYLGRDLNEAITHFERAERDISASQGEPTFRVSPEGQSLILFYLGRSNSGLGRVELARSWLTGARTKNPREPAVPLALALVYGALGQGNERDTELSLALDLVDTWLKAHPEDNAATYDRGIIYQILGKNAFALLDFDTVIKHDPRFYIAYISAGQVASALGKSEEAQDYLKAAVKLADQSGTNSAWAHLNLAMVYEKSGQSPPAKREYMEAIKAAPKVDWMYYYYARFSENQKEMDTAAINFQELAEVTLNKGWGYGNFAAFLTRRGLLQDALKNYIQAVHAQPDDALLHVYLAETFLALGDSESSLAEYKEAIAHGDTLYYVHASYAGALFQFGKFDLAAHEYERSLLLRPLDDAVLLNLGRTYENLGQIDKAKELYLRILRSANQFPKDAVEDARGRLRAFGVESP